jgi:cytochrome o ubiquinol oxidase subunit II
VRTPATRRPIKSACDRAGGILLGVSILNLSGCVGVLNSAGPVGADDSKIMLDALLVMLAIVVPTILMAFWMAWRYRASNTKADYRPYWSYSGRIEAVVWSIPTLTIIFIGGLIWIGSYRLDPFRPLPSKTPPVEVQVVALDWKWLFIYPEEGVASVNQLTIPLGTPVSLELTSSGVMNSFFVPQLAGQIYTMAGMVTRLNMQADYPGTYRGMSANFSGEGFADMHFNVEAVPPERFAQWVASTQSAGPMLDAQTYADLVKPSKAVTPFTYRAIAPGLFAGILSAGLQPDDGLCVVYPQSMRAER